MTTEAKNKDLLKIDRKTTFIDRFKNKHLEIICPGFWTLHWAMGCLYDPPCAMCWLQGTCHRYFCILKKKHGLRRKPKMVIYANQDKMRKDLQRWLIRTRTPSVLNTNELTDSLNTPQGIKLAKELMKVFQLENHKVLFLTKSADHAILSLPEYPTHNAIMSFSITPNREFEQGASPWVERLATAKAVSFQFKHLRLRIDPLIPIPNWPGLYTKMITAITEKLELRFERITMGRLRLFGTARNMVTDGRILEYACDRRPEDKRWVLPDEKFIEMARFIITSFPVGTEFALCKEPARIWKAIGLDPEVCKCNCSL